MLGSITKLLVAFLMKEPAQRGMPLCDFDRIKYELKPCDVILVEGLSRVSEIIKTITQSTWSHAALYIGRIHDIQNPILREKVLQYYTGSMNDQLVVEGMLGQGTIISSIENYKDEHVRICRPTGISQSDATKVIDFAIGRVGMEYGIRQNVDLARLLLPWSIMPRRWLSTIFDKTDSVPTKEICSSMIAEAFGSVQFPVLPIVKESQDKKMQLYRRNPRLFTPRDFDYSPYFDIIKYPFMTIRDHGIYRQLPWQETLASEHDDDVYSHRNNE